ncbi:hypothetical protein CRENBAI_003367 [Crenichthys baileyi]|uniref:Uncharacterized protein n=1 Tax=Crenichthys baileyi TaxID=28760 RepID=A0AAV9S8B5_9TELE
MKKITGFRQKDDHTDGRLDRANKLNTIFNGFSSGTISALSLLPKAKQTSHPPLTQSFPVTPLMRTCAEKKWKGLWDTFLKERRKELEKRSGAAAGAAKKWRFSAILSFLDPFVAPRPTTSNMCQFSKNSPEEETSETEDTNGEDTEERSTPSEAPAASSVSDSAPSSSAAAQPPIGRRRRTMRPREEPSEVERALLEALNNRPPPPPPRGSTPPWNTSSWV